MFYYFQNHYIHYLIYFLFYLLYIYYHCLYHLITLFYFCLIFKLYIYYYLVVLLQTDSLNFKELLYLFPILLHFLGLDFLIGLVNVNYHQQPFLPISPNLSSLNLPGIRLFFLYSVFNLFRFFPNISSFGKLDVMFA